MLTNDEILARARVLIDIYGNDAADQALVRAMKYTQEESLSIALSGSASKKLWRRFKSHELERVSRSTSTEVRVSARTTSDAP